MALVQDWLTGYRGGEKLLEGYAGLFPAADLYTLIHVRGSTSERIERLRIRASPLSRLPGVARHYRKLLPLFPHAIERFHLQGYDLVLSNSHSFAKGVRVAAGTPHVCSCLTPIRYVWDQTDAYLGRGLKRASAAPLVAYLRRWDRRTSTPERVTAFVAISRAVAERIRRHYGRDSLVVHPWVDTERFRPSGEKPEDFYLLVGGFVPYKNERLAIEAFRGLGRSLVVAGDGPTRRALEARAPENVRFTGRVSDARLAELYASCRALIHPQEEDFGIAAVEAQAAGRPVIALARGGARETVVGVEAGGTSPPTGLFFERPDTDALAASVLEFESQERHYEASAIRRHAERFSLARFRRETIQALEASIGPLPGLADARRNG
ncbi:MAG: glycosyltransferase [Myxococcota bacterium]